MLLLKSPEFLIFAFILRVIGIIYCINRAGKLNRNKSGWGLFAFLIPIMAMIWINAMEPKI